MIKSTVIKQGNQSSYPKLMVSTRSGSIYLMHTEKNGIRVHDRDNDGSIGKYCTCLDMSVLIDFDGSVTISNT